MYAASIIATATLIGTYLYWRMPTETTWENYGVDQSFIDTMKSTLDYINR